MIRTRPAPFRHRTGLPYSSRVLATSSDLVVTVLLIAVGLLLPATAAVLLTGQRRRRRHASARPFAAVLATAVALGGVGAAGAVLLGVPTARATVAALVVAGAVLAWWPIGRQWAVRGLVAWALTVTASVSYLVYAALWTLTADLTWAGALISGALWLVEAFVVLIGLGHLWEFVDVLTRRQWPASVDPRQVVATYEADPGVAGTRPFVSLHVPTHDEPPDMVIATLRRLMEQTYDRYEIVVIDNNTTDEALWRPVEEFCAGYQGVTFLHVENLEGFKSGALNLALQHTDPRAEIIGIVDADYLVEPDFLADCAPLFADPGLSFVQTPQDYRDWDVSAYFRRLYYSYGYFFDVSQVSRNEQGGAIFGGTMGLIRRSALVGADGWDEWCITEDAELSLRLLRDGGRGLHVDRSYGRGVMPLTFEALKKQRFRWCFGGVQILRMHWRSLLPGPRGPRNRLSLAQRWAYLVGGLQWFGDLAGVLFTGFLLLGAADAVVGTGIVVRRLSGLLLLCVVALVLLGLVRAVVLTRRSTGAGWRDAMGAFGLWLALGWVVAGACVRGLFARGGAFLRTPKQHGELRTSYALRANLTELVLGCLAVGVGVAALLHGTAASAAVGVLLAWQGAGYLLAPVNSVAAIRSHLPADLARRRRAGLATAGTVRWTGAVLVAGATAAVVVYALSGPELPDRPAVTSAISAATQEPSRDAGDSRGDDAPQDAPGDGAATDEGADVAPVDDPGAGAPPTPDDDGPEPGDETATEPAPTTSATPAPDATPESDPRPSQAADPTARPTDGPETKPTDRPTTKPTTKPTSRPAPTEPPGQG